MNNLTTVSTNTPASLPKHSYQIKGCELRLMGDVGTQTVIATFSNERVARMFAQDYGIISMTQPIYIIARNHIQAHEFIRGFDRNSLGKYHYVDCRARLMGIQENTQVYILPGSQYRDDYEAICNEIILRRLDVKFVRDNF